MARPGNHVSRASRFRAVVVAAVLGAHVLGAVPVADAASVTYTSPPVAGWSVNGSVRSVLVVGNRVIVGGTFTSAISPLGTRVARTNVAAFDVRTGDLDPSFVVSTNALVRSLATDGARVIIGGNFTTVNGVARSRVAAVDVFSGVLDTGFRADVNADVYDVEPIGSRLALGGAFSTVNGVTMRRLAMVDLGTGALDRTFVVVPDNFPRALQVSPDGTTLYVGGRHQVIGGVTSPRLAAVDLATKKVRPQPFGFLADEIIDLAVSPDGTQIYGAVGGAANLAAAWSTSTGVRQWYRRADGDVQAVEYAAGNVWYGFHEGAGGDLTVRLLGADAATGDSLDFRPSMDSFYGVWDIDATPTGLTIGGEFRVVDGVATRGLATFLDPSVPRRTTLLPAKSTWRYKADGSDQGTAWTDPFFDDSTWASGAGQLGFGDGDETTVVGWGPGPRKAITTYFRTTFEVADVSQVPVLTFNLVRDDGAVIYLNGVEVARSNMPAGPITALTRAASGANPENAWYRIDVPPVGLVAGTNVLAVEIHQDSPNSSDLSFDLQLTT